MNVYTKTGDQGTTALIGGQRVPKNHPRIEAYGTVDELMSHTAVLMDILQDGQDKQFLLWILDRLMTMSSVLAAEGDVAKRMPTLKADDVIAVENRIDEMAGNLEPLKNFILPGGHPAASQCDLARTVCRRTERVIAGLPVNFRVPAETTKYINRLSDYFFVLSRKIMKDSNIVPKMWNPVVD